MDLKKFKKNLSIPNHFRYETNNDMTINLFDLQGVETLFKIFLTPSMKCNYSTSRSTMIKTDEGLKEKPY